MIVLETDVHLPIPAPAEPLGMAARRPPPRRPDAQRVEVAPHKVTVYCFRGEESERGEPALQPCILALGWLTVCVASVVTCLPAKSEVIRSFIYVYLSF